MLTPQLDQIKNRLESKKSSAVLRKEEFELLKELKFLEEEKEIQPLLESFGEEKHIVRMIVPASGRCPACGQRLP